MKTNQKHQPERYAVCIHNEGYEVSLERLKLYPLVSPAKNDPAQSVMLRVIDETGEDYLFPSDWFVPLDLPTSVLEQINGSSARTDFTRYFAEELDDHAAAAG